MIEDETTYSGFDKPILVVLANSVYHLVQHPNRPGFRAYKIYNKPRSDAE